MEAAGAYGTMYKGYEKTGGGRLLRPTFSSTSSVLAKSTSWTSEIFSVSSEEYRLLSSLARPACSTDIHYHAVKWGDVCKQWRAWLEGHWNPISVLLVTYDLRFDARWARSM
jgi:hypothetical protein